MSASLNNNINEEQVSAAGERAAMGGYVPQFNEFANLAYRELAHGNLEWIKIADPEAEKLDDIQYATTREVHAYQVKWTTADKRISYLNFTTLLPLIVSSWQSLRSINASAGKKVIGHLLTNKQLSVHDSIESAGISLGTFSDFYREVWTKWKAKRPVDNKWNDIINQLITSLGLSKTDFEDFIDHFEFQPAHTGIDMTVVHANTSPQLKDLLDFRSFLLQNVADPARQVAFSKEEIIQGLGWESKFRTTFNHELFVDKKRYQAIKTTMNELNTKMARHNGGYLFLMGGPGTGKSTMLTEWVKQRPERAIKYYAFDFSNPSSFTNLDARGDATNLYFDLVLQLKAEGFYEKQLLPYRDLLFLKSVFRDQLSQLGIDYKSTGRGTIIIIDGLDHVPREYRSVTQSFLRELPLPLDLPDGVYIVLGSQTYDFEDLRQEIRNESRLGDRTVIMGAMERKEVLSYIDASELDPPLTGEQKQLLFEKSQGHPLYLSYLIEKIRVAENREGFLSQAVIIEGNIDLYYQKIWAPIHNNASLVRLLGLIARVNGSPSLDFIREWSFDEQILLNFRSNARLLFAQSRTELSFFHNSFRQFLLSETAKDALDNIFSRQKELNYHMDLAGFYETSSAEPHWKKDYHLYNAEAFDRFIAAASPEAFVEQLTDFRPIWEIKRDIRLGIEVARRRHDPVLLLRYLFSLAEIDRRLHNADPAAFIGELLCIEKFNAAKGYIRNGATLLIDSVSALKAARQLAELGHQEEALLVYSLAEPDMITADAVVVDYSRQVEHTTYDLLRYWLYTALRLQGFDTVFRKISGFTPINVPHDGAVTITPSKLAAGLHVGLCHALISYGEWERLNQLTDKWPTDNENTRNNLFLIFKYAADKSISDNEMVRASTLLGKILTVFDPLKANNETRIDVAELALTIDQNRELAERLLDGIPQPIFTTTRGMGTDYDFDVFLPLIKYNKILNLLGKGVQITDAIPESSFTAENWILAEFQRMICLITQVLCDGLQDRELINLDNRIRPIAHFFNRDKPSNNNDWYRLTRMKDGYFEFLIYAVEHSGQQQLEKLASYFSTDFKTHKIYWTAEQKRNVITALINKGYSMEKAKPMLHELEDTMLDALDIHGRISACSAHANAWILLNEKDMAEQWIKRALQESIGIGYRKDYQYNTWIDWLKTAIRVTPATAIENIRWFSSHLRHIQKSTEGKAYWMAASQLLQTTFEWNFEAGLKQLEWQLNAACIGFESALATFLTCYIDNSRTLPDYLAIMPVYTDIYLPIAVENDQTLIENLLNKGYELSSQDFFSTSLQTIYWAVVTNALEEHRADLISTIDKFVRSKGKATSDLIPGLSILADNPHDLKEGDTNILITLPGHTRTAETEVLKWVTNYDALKKLLQEEDLINSSFDWQKVMQVVLPDIGVNEIEEIVEIIKDHRKPTNILIQLSKHAQALGQHALAEKLLNKSIEYSSEAGWIEFYDGGTRILPFKALYELNGETAANRAFDVFSHDLMAGQLAMTYAENLEEILPVISPNYDELLVWEQVFNYLKRLMANSLPMEDLPDITPGGKSIQQCLTDLMAWMASRYHISMVSEPARRILAKQLAYGNNYASELIASLPIDTDAGAEHFIGILQLATECGAILDRYFPILLTLAASENFMLRQEAQRLLNKHSIKLPVIALKPLPAFYDLKLVNQPANVSHSASALEEIVKPVLYEIDAYLIFQELTVNYYYTGFMVL